MLHFGGSFLLQVIELSYIQEICFLNISLYKNTIFFWLACSLNDTTKCVESWSMNELDLF